MASVEGNFRIVRPARALPFTGERMTTEVEGQIEFEHLHRYCLARDLCADRDVLDIASGEGYGSAILAGVARSVVGVEIDADSVAHATEAYPAANLRFETGDALAIPLPDDSVDVVVSFETLEHVDDPAVFLSEVRRVLRPGGLLIVSTPNRDVYSAYGADANPYHRVEYTLAEFAAALGRHFAQAAFLQQRPVLGSAMVPASPHGAPAAEGPARTYERRSADLIEASSGLARNHYIIALASDGALPAIGASHYLDRRSVHRVMEDLARLPDLERAQRGEEERARGVEGRLEAVRADWARDRAELARALDQARRDLDAATLRETALRLDAEDAAAEAARLHRAEILRHQQEAERERTTAWAALHRERAAARTELEAEHARGVAVWHEAQALMARLTALEGSTAWRLLAPLRYAGRRLPRASRLARRGVKLLWWTATMQIGARYLSRRARLRALAAERHAALQLAGPGEGAEAVSGVAPVAAPPAPAAPLTDLRREATARDRGRAIHFPRDVAPRVTVVVPVYGGVEDLVACLRSMAATLATEPPFEVLLADDKPGDRATDGLPESPGLRVAENPENLGFLRTCNRAAARSKAEFLLFLNSDTLVRPGWLAALVAAAESDPRTGLVGSMLLNTDGTVQDAGWRILADGWGFPLGRGAAATSSAHTYRREADCVTGASLLVRRTVFEALGGFDDAYAPAFYEEFDLAFRARARGWRTVYEPASQVVHLGSASYGAAERDRLSVRNHATFVRRFADRLRRQPWGDADAFLLERAADTGPVILVVDDSVPRPDRHAGGVTLAQYLGLMAMAGWRVIFAPHDGLAEGEAAEVLKRQGIEVLPGGQEATIDWLAENGRHLRHAWIARPGVAPAVLPALRAHSAALVAYYTHDLHHVRMRQEAALHGDDPAAVAEAERMRETEIAIFRAVDCVMSPNPEESAVAQTLSPGTRVVTVPPYYVAAEDAVPRDAAAIAGLKDIVFVGGFPHRPNVDAALFTAREVMPLIWERVPEARLVLVGYAPPPEVQALASDRIVVTGQVPELDPYFLGARLSLAALRYGAGVKGKVVQALQFATPVVTTTIGAEGLGLTPGEHALVADDARGLADAALALLEDPVRSAALGEAGLCFIRGRLSRAAAREALDTVFGTACCRVCGSARLTAPEPPTADREGFACHNCYALSRSAALAAVMVEGSGEDGSTSLAEVARAGRLPAVLEIGFAGAIAEVLRGSPSYQDCEYFEGVLIGQRGPGGVRNEDVGRLTFPDASFDLVICQEVMEHVPDPRAGFEEMRRVLRPGGRLLFTIPVNWKQPQGVTRTVIEAGRPRFLLDPAYHGDPVRGEGALVFTDFGADAPSFVESCGFAVRVHQVCPPGSAVTVQVFEARPEGGPTALRGAEGAA